MLRAGVSSFGVGGTNAHVVLEEAPAVPASTPQPGPQVLLMSARSTDALQQSRSALAAELSGDEVNLSDVAYTLTRRRNESVRMAAVVKDQQDAVAVLGAAEHDNVFIGESSLSAKRFRPRRLPVPRSGCAAHRDGPRPLRLRAGVRRTLRPRAPQGSATSWVSTCARRSSRAPRATWSAPIAPSPRCSRSSMRWRSWSRPTAFGPRRWPDTASASTSPAPWPACSTSRRPSRWCRCGLA